jgi:hypothetical protein
MTFSGDSYHQENSMKAIHTAIVVSVGLIVALWWAVLPPRFEPRPLPSVDAHKQQQCPAGSRLEGKLCTCPAGSTWTGAACS